MDPPSGRRPAHGVDGELRLYRAKRVATHALKLGVADSSRLTAKAIRDARHISELLDLFPLIYKADVISRSALVLKSGKRPGDVVLRTSGSSGGVVEIPWRIADLIASRRSYARIVARARYKAGLNSIPRKPLLAMGASSFHVSAALYESIAPTSESVSLRLAVNSDMATVVANIVAAVPDHLTTYPSIGAQLVGQSLERFPTSIVLGGEHARDSLKRAIEARGSVLLDTYGCTEIGIIAVGVGASGVLTILHDDVVVERVGIPGSRPGYERIALTSLHNTSCPVLRLVVDDEVQVACANGNLVTGLQSVYPSVDPPLIKIAGRDVFSRSLRGALDSALTRGSYRITVRSGGLDIMLDRESRHFIDQVRANIWTFLFAIGATDQDVRVNVVDAIAGGKAVRRLVVEGVQ
jgi:phenylacetate-coenzyme A ligase PaaK-like adenylate-forming protein